ncbi:MULTISPECIES: hypothetical protein [unclassified Ruegeria]|uniref:hypothetical protein n=1 Tax=unclassified Ruegeria TaxID=2625375 RepID=UPI001489F84F|nr:MULTISPECIES: hypothetical protein [unclassified Ruegeria]
MTDPAMVKSGHDRIENDAYDTLEAKWLVKALKRAYGLPSVAWEPHAGKGDLVDALKNESVAVYASDKTPRRHDVLERNFFDYRQVPSGQIRGIVMNPPYDDLDIHVEHALFLMAQVKGTVALLARAEWSYAKSRAHLFKFDAFAAKVELTTRPRWFADGSGSPRHNFAWYIWDFIKSPKQKPVITWGVK